MNNPREHLHCSRRGCNYTTNRAYNLERHERNHDKGKVPISQCQPCPHCKYAAGSLHNLMRHISKKHIETIEKSSPATTSQQAEELPELPATQKTIPSLEPSPEVVQPVEQPAKSSLWHWSTPQQQERNFLRRSGLKNECTILERRVSLYKLYTLVKVRGGALNVDEWDDVAAALGLPPGSGCNVGVKYMEMVFEFEKREDDRLLECQDVEGVPLWWDDGDFMTENMEFTNADTEFNGQSWTDMNRPSFTVQNAVVKLIYEKYYSQFLRNSKPFQRFEMKDSWLQATMLSYHALKSRMHLRHGSAS